MMLGPIDYVVVGFRGNNFDGSILSELSKAVNSGVIRVIDLLFVVKDADGTVVGGEVADQPEELKAMLSKITDTDSQPMLSEDDLKKISASMENDTAAGALVIEHLWAKGLKKSLIDAGGTLLDEGRIHPERAEAALEEIEQTGKQEVA